ncbi:DUF1014-domain-containing protein [Phlegmacium glaucopus]|nr:DUF1014-domain-containing protein [Phlegmacium glaucopus]
MPPKGGNAKKESGRSKKADNEAKKKDEPTAEKDQKDKDVKGGKSKQEDKEEKRKADLARKAENARLLAEEEAAVSKPKAAPKKKATKDAKPAGPGAIAAGGGLSPEPTNPTGEEPAVVESYAATGIDNALDLLEVVTAKTDKASVGQQAAGIERHPERRFKGVFEAYLERELPNIKQERPGLRLQQYKDLLHKQFEKSPENPFNQATVAYDAKKEEKLQALQNKKTEVEERLREK